MTFLHDSISGTPNSNWLVSLAEAKQYLKTDTTLEESLSGFLTNTITLISDRFEEYIERGIKAQNYIGYYDGRGTSRLYLENYPINSISTLQYNYSPTENWNDFYTGSSTANIVAYTDNILLWSNTFPCGHRNIKISYNAGYSTIPAEIKTCALESIQAHYNYSKFGNDTLGYKSKNMGGQVGTSEVYEDLAPKHMKILDKYKRVTI